MISIKSVMTTNVITVKETTPIYEAMMLLSEHRISGMPVVNGENEVVGVLSEKDVLVILLDKKMLDKMTVGNFMSKNTTCFTEETSAVEICEFFMKSHFRRVPILRNGKLIGVVSRRDIIKLILEARNLLSQDRYH